MFKNFLVNGKTLIYIACLDGDLELVKLFLNKNIDPTIKIKVSIFFKKRLMNLNMKIA